MDNLNVYGPTRDVTVVGYGKTELESRLETHARAQDRVVRPEAFPERGGFYRSDHFNLAKIGIPVLYARGGGDLRNGGPQRGEALANAYVAQRYHKPDDEIADDWDLIGASQDLQLFYALGRELADGDDWPRWLEGAEFGPIREAARAGR
jgi:Zn-dependent M28 family amino/carboxypeptidase